MSSVDDFDLDDPTPVTDLVDPRRTMLEAELQVARSAHESVLCAWKKSERERAKLEAVVAERDRTIAAMSRREAETKERHRRETEMLEMANLKLREERKKR